MQYEVTVDLKQAGDRNSTRKAAVEAFLAEHAGTGRKDLATNYRYNVEILRDGRRIYLRRPAWRRAGFDFVIHLEGEVFQNRQDNPAHDDVHIDLAAKARENPRSYEELHEALCRVYACEDPDDILREYGHLPFESGLSVEAVLKIVKWFFIEQDIRYWNYSGRGMFKAEVIDAVAADCAT